MHPEVPSDPAGFIPTESLLTEPDVSSGHSCPGFGSRPRHDDTDGALIPNNSPNKPVARCPRPGQQVSTICWPGTSDLPECESVCLAGVPCDEPAHLDTGPNPVGAEGTGGPARTGLTPPTHSAGERRACGRKRLMGYCASSPLVRVRENSLARLVYRPRANAGYRCRNGEFAAVSESSDNACTRPLADTAVDRATTSMLVAITARSVMVLVVPAPCLLLHETDRNETDRTGPD